MAHEKRGRMWVVMKVHKWSTIETSVGKLTDEPSGGLIGYMPIYRTREEAVEADGGSDEHVYEVVAR